MNDSSRNGIMKKFKIGFMSDLVLHPGSSLWAASGFLRDAYNYLKTSLDTTTQRLRPTVSVVATQFGFYLTTYFVLCYCLYLVRILFRNWMAKSKYFDSSAVRILLVIAHPDDECMFFGPLIVRMVRMEKCVYLLCLCNGGADGRGALRKRELWASCRVLGLRPENVFLYNSGLRVEGGVAWRAENIAALVHDHVEALDIDTLVTFDKYGITGNADHMATFRAVSFLNLRKQLPINCHIFLLDSLGFVRRYSSVMDAALSILWSKNVFILPPYEQELVRRALKMHRTQLRWYRRLYMRFSRYTYVNSLSELPRYTGRHHVYR